MCAALPLWLFARLNTSVSVNDVDLAAFVEIKSGLIVENRELNKIG